MRERSVYCVACGGPAAEIASSLASAGWNTQVIDQEELHQLEHLAETAAIGILVFGDTPAGDTERLCSGLDQLGELRWIAHLPMANRGNEIPPSVAARMCDYLSPPHHPESLLRTLRRSASMQAMQCLLGEQTPAALLGMGGDLATGLEHAITLAAQRPQSPVLVWGNQGCGKELVARAIHARSDLRERPFLVLNCGTLPHSLMETMLFGDAENSSWQGVVARAAGGSLYLDSPDDLPTPLQERLAELLLKHRNTVYNADLPADMPARLLLGLRRSADEGELQKAATAGGQLQTISLPALEGRAEDIEMLAQQYLDCFASRLEMETPGFARQSLQRIVSYEWPGNVRELVGRVQKGLMRAENRLIFPSDLGLDRRSPARKIKTLQQARAEAERDALMRSLQYAGNNVAEAARALGISRLTVHRLMDKHGVAATPSLDQLAG